MDISRTELLPGVALNYVHSDKFKTSCLSLTMLTQLTRESASMNALLPFVLRRGTALHGDMESISAALDNMYGAAIEPVVRRIGEIQCIGFYSGIPEREFLPGKYDALTDCANLLGEMLLTPNTRGGLLLSQYVESEKENMIDLIRSRINDKIGYAVRRCIEEMCCFEDFSVSRYGTEEDCENINYKKLSRHYKELLPTVPVEIFYCGRESEKRVSNILRSALAAMPRGEINYDIGTDVRMNAVNEEPRCVTEEMDVTQGKLVIGYRLGEIMEEPDFASIYVFNCIFGSGTTSKLFMNVRERLQLCYYASSMTDLHKGLLLVHAGIEFDKLEETKSEIFAQLDAMKNGDITDEEFECAKACVASDLRSLTDSQGGMEGFYLANILEGLDYGPEELAELVEFVTKEQVIEIANSVECDAIYFLKRWENEEDAEEVL